MTSTQFLSRSIDYLGDLGAKLRDLQGYRTLFHELIQNADDAPASWMAFDTRPDALILDNDGTFSDCGDVEKRECPWNVEDAYGHRCDFHRFRLIGSGDKRLQEGTTGAFGIGFIAAYQLTDQPELISGGHHWILHEERAEDKRIEICLSCPNCNRSDLPGTRFIFPFAREEQSALRQALKADPAPKDVTARLLDELASSLPVAMLFLKSLNSIEVKDNGNSWLKFQRESDNDTLIISQGSSSNDQVWRLIRGNFQSRAEELRRQHPGRIEDKRSSAVVIALPIERELSAGLLCACLPTEEGPGLPFHINADFFTSNDRKHVILGGDYQAQWNREALLAAARTVAEATPRLTLMVGAERFWHLASAINNLAVNASKNSRDPVWVEFWRALEVALKREPVIFTSSSEWTTANSGVAAMQQQEEALNITVMEGLGIKLVAEELRPHQGLLRSVGVPILDIETLCSALTTNGLDKPICRDELPHCLTSKDGRAALWTEVTILLRRRESTPRAKRADEQRLRAVSLAPSRGRFLRPCGNVYSADASTVQLFSCIGLDIPFLDQAEAAFEPLSYLCDAFKAGDAIEALEGADFASIHQL